MIKLTAKFTKALLTLSSEGRRWYLTGPSRVLSAKHLRIYDQSYIFSNDDNLTFDHISVTIDDSDVMSIYPMSDDREEVDDTRYELTPLGRESLEQSWRNDAAGHAEGLDDFCGPRC